MEKPRYWTKQEKELFRIAIRMTKWNDYTGISSIIRTRNKVQARTHVQKRIWRVYRLMGEQLTTDPLEFLSMVAIEFYN